MEVKYNWECVIERVSDCDEQHSHYCAMPKIEVHDDAGTSFVLEFEKKSHKQTFYQLNVHHID